MYELSRDRFLTSRTFCIPFINMASATYSLALFCKLRHNRRGYISTTTAMLKVRLMPPYSLSKCGRHPQPMFFVPRSVDFHDLIISPGLCGPRRQKGALSRSSLQLLCLDNIRDNIS